VYCGIDWATRRHTVCVVDQQGRPLERFEVAHSEAGLGELVDRLGRLCPAARLPVAIERPGGVLVERLVAAGHPVVPIHPNAFAARRVSWGSSGAKDDRSDAQRLADMLRTDRARLGELRPVDPRLIELQALVRLREDHLSQRVAATNRLQALLEAHWPGAGAVFGRLDSPIALEFLQRYPAPERARGLGPERMRAFLARHSYCGRRSPEELLGRLRAAPAAPGRLDQELIAELVGAQVRLVRALLGTIADLERAIGALLIGLRQARLLEGLPRIGRLSLAQVLAEVGPLIGRCRDAEQLAVLVGAAPVTRSSGQQRSVGFRLAASRPARQALATFCDNSRHGSAWAADIYARARARGKRHPHAIRILMRAWIRVIWACWHSQTPYDPALHGGARRLAAGMGLT
jgi:transposase